VGSILMDAPWECSTAVRLAELPVRFLEFATRCEKTFVGKHHAVNRETAAGQQVVLSAISQAGIHRLVVNFVEATAHIFKVDPMQVAAFQVVQFADPERDVSGEQDFATAQSYRETGTLPRCRQDLLERSAALLLYRHLLGLRSRRQEAARCEQQPGVLGPRGSQPSALADWFPHVPGSTEQTLTFRRPFSRSAVDGPLPAGRYRVITEEEPL
jgi:hypothetical protein